MNEIAATGAMRLVAIPRLAAQGRWRVEAMRAISEPCLLWFTKGQGRITVAGTTRGYTAHNAVFIPAGIMHGFEIGPQVFGTAVFFGRGSAGREGTPTTTPVKSAAYRKAMEKVMEGVEVTSLPLPNWLRSVPKEQLGAARTRFLIRVASLYATPIGSMTALSTALELHPHTMATLASGRESLSHLMCPRIEKLVGKSVMPRSLLNPVVFAEA